MKKNMKNWDGNEKIGEIQESLKSFSPKSIAHALVPDMAVPALNIFHVRLAIYCLGKMRDNFALF